MTQPNIVLIVADDMREDLLPFMPFVGGTLRALGTRFTNARCSIPVCSPFRAGVLTGQYARGAANHVYTNDVSNITDPTHDSLPVWVKAAGYNTGMFGKTVIPGLTGPEPGWDSWAVMKANVQQAYGYVMTDGTTPTPHQLTYLTTQATTFIAAATTPWFCYFASTNPHINTNTLTNNPMSNTQYKISDFHPTLDLLADVYLGDKPDWISTLPQFTAGEQAIIKQAARQQAREVWDLDAAVHTIYDAVTAKGQQANTLYLFVSDSGVFWGEQRLGDVFAGTKGHPYDCVARIPCVLKGPGVAPGATITAPVIGQDVTATICAAAGATATVAQDGVNMLGTLNPLRDTLYERASDPTFPNGTAIVTPTRKLAKWVNLYQYEMYDLDTDPNELTNVAYVGGRLSERNTLEAVLDGLLA